jgi:hypothetical protein
LTAWTLFTMLFMFVNIQCRGSTVDKAGGLIIMHPSDGIYRQSCHVFSERSMGLGISG